MRRVKAPKPKVSEQQIETAIINYLRVRGIFAFKVFNGGSFNEKRGRYLFGRNRTKGVSDIIACHRGRFIAIEVKSASGRMSDDQIRWQVEAQQAGALTLVARSVQDVHRFFDEVEK